MSYNLRRTPARPNNSVRPASSRSTDSLHAARRTTAPVTMTLISDFCTALKDPAVLQALGVVIEKSMQELLKNFDGRIQDLETKVKARDDRIEVLENEVRLLKVQSSKFDGGIDEQEQYSRSNSVRIQNPNWEEKEDENCTALVMKYAKDNDVELSYRDFDACHRVGKKQPNNPRPILVKFIRRDHRTALLRTRTTQRQARSNIFVNEDLTAMRAEAAREARSLVKKNKIASSYVFSGKIVISTNDGQSIRITNIQQLAKYVQ